MVAVIEVLHLDKENIKTMSRAISNGKQSEIELNNSINVSDVISKSNGIEEYDRDFYSTFGTQFSILLKRRLTQMARNTVSIYLQNILAFFL